MKKTIAFTMMATSLISMEAMASHFGDINDEMKTPDHKATYERYIAQGDSPFTATSYTEDDIDEFRKERSNKVARKLTYDKINKEREEEIERKNDLLQKANLLKQEAAEAEKRANLLKQEAAAAAERANRLQQDINALNISLQDITDRAENTAEEKQAIEDELTEKTQKFEDEITALEEQSETLKENLSEKNTALEGVEENLRQQQTELDTQREALDRAEEEKTKTADELEKQKQALDEKTAELAEQQDLLQTNQQDLNNTQQVLEDTAQKLKKTEESREFHMNRLRGKINKIDTECFEQALEIEELKNSVTEKENTIQEISDSFGNNTLPEWNEAPDLIVPAPLKKAADDVTDDIGF